MPRWFSRVLDNNRPIAKNASVNDSPGAVLIAREKIAARVTELAGELTRHYAGKRPLFLGVMNGALFFLADLVREV